MTGRDQVGMRDGVKETKKRSGKEIGRGLVSRLLAVWYQVSVEGWTGMGEEREGVTVICRATRNGLSVVANAASLAQGLPSPAHSDAHAHAHAHALSLLLC